jgi:hypothetical protein
MNKRDYKHGDILRLTDTRVVRFIERGGIPGKLIVQVDREGSKDIIDESEVVEHSGRHEINAYARK